MRRREFTEEAVAALLSGMCIAVADCGGRDAPAAPTPPQPTPSPPPAPSPTPAPLTDAVGEITNNHRHEAIVTVAQILEGASVRLNIKGQSKHAHTVDLDASDLEVMRQSSYPPIVKLSSRDEEHRHTITFTKRANALR